MTFSIVIPAYNAAAFLETTIPAVLALDGALEWIWVDDGSTDDTAAEIERLTDGHPRVTVLRLGSNHGRAAARNAGFELANGDWVACLDADARPRAGYLAAHQAVIESSDASVSMGHIHAADPAPGDPYGTYLNTYARGPQVQHGAASWKYFVTCAACIRTDVLRSVGGFDSSIGYGEDAELACRLAQRSPDGLYVASQAIVDLYGTETLDGACQKAAQFGRSLRQIEVLHPDALEQLELASLNRPVSQAVLRSSLLARLVASLLGALPATLVSTGVRYLLGHAMVRGYTDA
ncbi:MAG: hypothetical protein Rubg2KO_15070 [Rubricoccaceae bacterium]